MNSSPAPTSRNPRILTGSIAVSLGRPFAKNRAAASAGIFAATAASLVLSLATPSAHAASATWNGNTSNVWGTTANWSAATPGTGDTATFSAASGNTTIDLGSGVTIGTVAFTGASAAAYTIGSGAVNSQTLTIDNGGSVTMSSTTGNNTLVNAAILLGNSTASSYIFSNTSTSKTLTFAGTIAGGSGGTAGAKTLNINAASGADIILNGNISNGSASALGLTMGSSGTVTLSGSNTYTGATLVNAGTLSLSSATALGSTVGNTTVASGAGVQLTNGITVSGETITISGTGVSTSGALYAGTGNGTWGGTIVLGDNSARIGSLSGNVLTVTGSITDGAGNTLVTNGASATSVVLLNPTGTNTYTGTTKVIRGILRIGKTDALPTGTILDVRANTGAGGTNPTFDLAGFNQTVAGLQDSATDSTSQFVTNSVAGSTSTLTVSGSGSTVFDGAIQNGSGNVTLTQSGTGTLTLNGTNTYTGVTLISGGVLNSATFAAVNTSSGIGKGSAGGSAADLVLNGGRLQYTGSAAATTNRLFSVGTSGGTIDASGSNNANALTFTGTGAIGFNGQSGARTLTLTGSNTGSNSLAGVLGDNSGATSLAKTGAGKWVVSGNNTYTGPTSVSDGTLAAGVVSVAGASGAFGKDSAVSLTNIATAILDITGFNTRIGSITGGGGSGGNVILGSATLTLGGDNTSPAAYAGSISGAGSALKIGTGTQIFSGSSSYSGTTTISAGSLVAGASAPSGSAGAFGNATSAIVLGDAATLSNNSSPSLLTGGAVTIGRAVTVASQATSGVYTLGGSTAASSAFTGNITLNRPVTLTAVNGGVVDFNTGTWITNGNPITITGAGTSEVKLSQAITSVGGIAVNSGKLNLASAFTGNVAVGGGATLSGNGSVSGNTGLTGGIVNGTGLGLSGGVTFNSTGNTLSGTVISNATLASGAALALNGGLTGPLTVGNGTLTGTGSASGATGVTGGTVNGTGLALNGGTTFNGAGNTLSGTVTSNATLASGAALALNGALTGNAVVGSGTLSGSGSVSGTTGVTGGTVNGSGLVLSGGTTFNGAGNTLSGTVATNATLASGAALALNGALTGTASVGNGALTGSGSVSGTTSVSSGGSITGSGLTLTGVTTLSGTSSFGGTITSGSRLEVAPSSTVAGVGTLTGSATTYGVLNLNGTVTGAVTVKGGGKLGGNSSVSTLSIEAGGTHSPGNSPGSTIVTGNSYSILSSTLELDLGGRNGSAAHQGYDRAGIDYDFVHLTNTGSNTVDVSGTTLSLKGGAFTFSLQNAASSSNPYVPGAAGNSLFDNLFIISNDGTGSGVTSVTGSFANLDTGRFNGVLVDGRHVASIFLGLQEFALSYTGNAGTGQTFGGNDVVLTAIPEPGAAVSLLGGLGMLIALRRRRRC